jgi:hypothetical protein
MQYHADFAYRIKKYFPFSHAELKHLGIVVVALSFIISFKDWGGLTFDAMRGLINWFNGGLVVLLVFLTVFSVQRLVGIYLHYRVEYSMWVMGILVGLAFSFVSLGRFWFLLPGGVVVHHLAGHRLGFFRYGLDYFKIGIISFSGTLAALFLGFVFKVVYFYVPTELVGKLVKFCVVYAIFDILPIPPLTGSKLFYGSRLAYAFGAAFTIGTGLLLLTNLNGLLAGILGVLFAVVCWFIYYVMIEKHLWKGPYSGGWAPKNKK